MISTGCAEASARVRKHEGTLQLIFRKVCLVEGVDFDDIDGHAIEHCARPALDRAERNKGVEDECSPRSHRVEVGCRPVRRVDARHDRHASDERARRHQRIGEMLGGVRQFREVAVWRIDQYDSWNVEMRASMQRASHSHQTLMNGAGGVQFESAPNPRALSRASASATKSG